MQDIADAVGTSKMTVSRILRGDVRSASKSLRERILTKAEELGYLRNPLISAAMAERRSRGSSLQTVKIAYVMGDPAQKLPIVPDVQKGAEQRAEELGFLLETILTSKAGGSGRRLRQILDSRGVDGCLFSLAVERQMISDFDMSGLCCATHHLKLRGLGIPLVTIDYTQHMHVALAEAMTRGFKKPGMIFSGPVSTDMGRNLLAALALHAFEQSVPFIPAFESYTTPDALKLREWLSRWEPEIVILVGKNSLADFAVLSQEEKSRRGWIQVAAPHVEQFLAATIHEGLRIGAALVDRIASALYRNDRGTRHAADMVFSEVRFKPGPSLPSQPRKKTRKKLKAN
ncbi:MAG: LacI family DNA-binding transcriptional regulator [Opitutales bacterium]